MQTTELPTTATALIRSDSGQMYVHLDGKIYRLDPDGSPAFRYGSSEHITPARAYTDYGPLYGGYVWACHAIYGPHAPVYHAHRGVLNGMGHTGDHSPPWRGQPVAGIASWDECQVLAVWE